MRHQEGGSDLDKLLGRIKVIRLPMRLVLMSIKRTARLSVGLAMVILLLYRFDPSEVFRALVSADYRYLAFALLIYPVTLALLTARWRAILSRMGGSLPWGVSYQAFVGGVFVSDLTPARLGDLTRPLMVRDRLDLDKGAASVMVDKYADVFTTFILGLAGLLLLFHQSNWYVFMAAFSLFFVLSSTTLLWLKRPLVINAVETLGSERFVAMASSLDRVFSSARGLGWVMAYSIFLTAVAWMTQALRTSLVVRAFGFDVPFHVLFLLQPLISTLSLVPVTISGLGLIEGGMTALFTGLGVPPSAGIAAALVDRALTVLVHILVGARYAVRMV